MEPSQPPIETTLIIATVVAVLAILVVFRVFRARTPWMLFLRWGLIILIALAWQIHFTDSFLMQHEVRTPPPLEEALPAPSELPAPLLISLVLAAVIWVGGINWVVIRQRRRIGRGWAEILNPFNSPFRDMDRKAFMQIAVLAALGLAVVTVGAELSVPDQPAHPVSSTGQLQD